MFYTAHYDHLGIDPDAKGDDIYNGAADNGTGCGMLLEMARAYAEAKVQPAARGDLCGGDGGGAGAAWAQEYLGMHPPIPAKEIALDLNYDMLMPLWDSVVRRRVGGAERTTFYPVVEKTAQAFHLELQAGDQTPGCGHYYRWDHGSAWQGLGFRHFPLVQGTLFEGHDAAWGMRSGEGVL